MSAPTTSSTFSHPSSWQSSQISAASHPRVIPFRDFLGPKDVICGRGKGFDDTEGNRNFRVIMKSYANEYAATPRAEKHAILTKVMKFVKAREFRFVKGKNDNWRLLSDDEIRRKIAHALRDAHCDRRQHKAAAGNFMKTKRSTSTGTTAGSSNKAVKNKKRSTSSSESSSTRKKKSQKIATNQHAAVRSEENLPTTRQLNQPRQLLHNPIFLTLLEEIRQAKAALLAQVTGPAPVFQHSFYHDHPATTLVPQQAVPQQDPIQTTVAQRIRDLELALTPTPIREAVAVVPPSRNHHHQEQNDHDIIAGDVFAMDETASLELDDVEDILDDFQDDEGTEELGEDYDFDFGHQEGESGQVVNVEEV